MWRKAPRYRLDPFLRSQLDPVGPALPTHSRTTQRHVTNDRHRRPGAQLIGCDLTSYDFHNAMVRQWLIRFSTRLARAVLRRLASDIELMQALEAGVSSAAFASHELAHATTITSRETLLREALKLASPDGMICEFGVYRGASLSLIAAERPDERVYGLDSFDGLPTTWRSRFPRGAFKVDQSELPIFARNVGIYRGLFSDTLPKLLRDDARSASFLHIDCDLYESTQCVFNLISDRLRPGTIIVFDEYFNYPGWDQHEHRALLEAASTFGFTFDYLLYNHHGEQVAIAIRATKQSAPTHL